MSREIKFRTWSKSYKQWCGGTNYIDGVWLGWIRRDGKDIMTQAIILEQYTGVKDKNGKEIYEGDIVSIDYDLENIEPEDCCVITFSNGCFRVGNGYENEAGSYLKNWTIVGNIHENQELIRSNND